MLKVLYLTDVEDFLLSKAEGFLLGEADGSTFIL
jgi:hypothetical protein